MFGHFPNYGYICGLDREYLLYLGIPGGPLCCHLPLGGAWDSNPQPSDPKEWDFAIVVAGMLGHSIAILLTTYAHFIPSMQSQAAQLMDNIMTPIPIEFIPKHEIRDLIDD
jgi:hypothetical protein